MVYEIITCLLKRIYIEREKNITKKSINELHGLGYRLDHKLFLGPLGIFSARFDTSSALNTY